MAYIEIKTRKYIDSTLAKQIVSKGRVCAVLTTGKISKPAKPTFSKEEYKTYTYPLRKFQQILSSLKNTKYKYLERV